jgi:hypothetical protein
MFLSNSNPIIKNSIISDNYLQHDSGGGVSGGGIYCENSSPSLINVTISNNADGGIVSGGAHPLQKGNDMNNRDSNLILINSIVWNNGINMSEGSLVATYSNIINGWEGEGNIDADPQFTDPDNGDFTLQFTSPCIDAGDPNSPLDLDGTISDMGAIPFTHIVGCTNFYSSNYNPEATSDDGSCEYDPHFDCLSGFYNIMGVSIYDATINDENIQYLDEIAIYDGDLCVGSYQLAETPPEPMVIIVPEDDPNTDDIDGFIAGNQISFRLWDISEQVEITGVTFEVLNGDDIFEPLGNSDFNINGSLIYGCNNPDACNYDPSTTVSDDSCWYFEDNGWCDCNENYVDTCGVCGGNDEDIDGCGVCFGYNVSCSGCTDPYGLNYDPYVNVDDGSCEYPMLGDINGDGIINISKHRVFTAAIKHNYIRVIVKSVWVSTSTT